MEIDLKKFDKDCKNLIDNFQEVPDASPRTQEELRTIYGHQEMDIKSPDEIEPPNTTQYITNTNNYLKKLKKNGFIKGDMAEEFKKELLQKNLYDFSSKKDDKSKSSSANNSNSFEALSSEDPTIQSYLKTDTVKSFANELSSLPFRDGLVMYQAVNAFYNNVTLQVRKMKMSGKRIDKTKVASALKKDMFEFVVYAQSERKRIITKAILEQEVNIDLLTKKQKKEFSKEIEQVQPKTEIEKEKIKIGIPSNQKTTENTENFLDHIRNFTDKLPPAYEMKDDTFIEEKLKEIVKKQNEDIHNVCRVSFDSFLPKRAASSSDAIKINPPQPTKRSSTVLTRKPPSILGLVKHSTIVVPQLEKDKPKKASRDIEKVNQYWFDNDPLGKSRKGQPIDVFNQFSDLVKFDDIQFNEDEDQMSISYPHLLVKDYRPPTAVVIDDKSTMITDSIWSTAQMSNAATPVKGKRERKEKEEHEQDDENENEKNEKQKKEDVKLNNFTADELMDPGVNIHQSDAMRFLMSRIIVDEGPESESSKQIRLLKEYLQGLGFSTYQKLEIFKKYSLHVNQISENLGYWENALSCFNDFVKSYKDLKFYLETSVHLSKQNPQFLTLYNNFDMFSTSLQDVGESLKTITDDCLFLKGIEYNRYIEKKKNKLQSILEERLGPGA